MANNKSISTAYSMIALIGAIIGIIGIFMAWMDFFGLTHTGWEFITDSLENPEISLDGYVQWTPLVVLVFSVIGLLSAMVGLARPGKTGGAGAIMSGVFVIIGAILFITYTEDIIGFTFKMSDFLGTGVYLAVIAGILMLIFGALMSSAKTSK